MRTYLSYNSRGFPNFWILNGPQGVLTTSFVAQLEWCATHAAFMIKKMEAEGIRAVEPKQEAEDAYCANIYEASTQTLKTDSAPGFADGAAQGQAFFANCTPGYYNSEGNVKIGKTLNANYNGGIRGSATEFLRKLEAVRNEGRVFDDFDLER